MIHWSAIEWTDSSPPRIRADSWWTSGESGGCNFPADSIGPAAESTVDPNISSRFAADLPQEHGGAVDLFVTRRNLSPLVLAN